MALCRRRQSGFADIPGEYLELGDIAAFVRIAYGNPSRRHKAVPSAGALWPLRVAAVLTTAAGDTNAYWYDDIRDELVDLGERSPDALARCFLGERNVSAMLTRAGVIVVMVDPSAVVKKYSSRGYKYGLIEVGAAMQNMYLLGAETGLGVRAVGGFYDSRFTRFFGLPNSWHPELSVLVTR